MTDEKRLTDGETVACGHCGTPLYRVEDLVMAGPHPYEHETVVYSIDGRVYCDYECARHHLPTTRPSS